jgi:multidrug resistance protein, MATE family
VLGDTESSKPYRSVSASPDKKVDIKAIIALALPFFLNSALNAVLNLTDTWFIAKLSSDAVAAMGAIYWASLTLVIFLGGAAMAVQTYVAQAIGSQRKRRASHWMWTGMYAAIAVAPLFWLAAYAGANLIHFAKLEPHVAKLAIEYWQPRMWTAPIGTALWTVLSFINGTGNPRFSLAINILVALSNAVLNQVFMFELGMGMAGAAWATGASLLLGLIASGLVLLKASQFANFPFSATWRFRRRAFNSIFALGIPTGLFIALDLIALSFFQLYQTQLGPIGGAATQVVMMLTSIAYMPAVGIGTAGATLVAQAIGAGDRSWAYQIGNATIKLATIYMTVVGVAVALASPWLMTVFTNAHDPQAAKVIQLGITLAWIAAAYQFFDGLNIASAFCLRAAGDARVPSMMLGCLAWFVFIPLAQMLTFGPGQTWFSWLPGFGYGAIGGWVAACIYIGLLGTMLLLRWRSGAWRKITLR